MHLTIHLDTSFQESEECKPEPTPTNPPTPPPPPPPMTPRPKIESFVQGRQHSALKTEILNLGFKETESESDIGLFHLNVRLSISRLVRVTEELNMRVGLHNAEWLQMWHQRS